MKRHRTSRSLGIFACVTLLLTAALHAAALPEVSQAANAPSSPAIVQTFFVPLWLFPIATWLVLAALLAAQLYRAAHFSRVTMIAAGAIPFLQALTLFALIGHFPGAYALVLASALIWASAATMRNGEQPN